MRAQLLLAIVVIGAGAAGYYEEELRAVAGKAIASLKAQTESTSDLPSDSVAELPPVVDSNLPPPDPAGASAPPVGAPPANIPSADGAPPGGLNDALRSFRGLPAEGAEDRRSEYLERLRSESGIPANPAGATLPLPGQPLLRDLPPPSSLPPPGGVDSVPGPILSGPRDVVVPDGPDPVDPMDDSLPDEPTDEEVDSFDMDSEDFDGADEVIDEPEEDLPPDEGADIADAGDDGV